MGDHGPEVGVLFRQDTSSIPISNRSLRRSGSTRSSHTPDDPPDLLPIDSEDPRDRRRVRPGHKLRNEIIEIAGEPRAVARERNTLDMHPMLRTIESLSQARADIESPHPEIRVPPDRLAMLAVLAMARRVRAPPANKATTTQRNDHDDSAGREVDRANPTPGRRSRRENAVQTRHGHNLQLGDPDLVQPARLRSNS